MAIIAPFCGLRFNPDKVGKLEEVVTPPYDIISEKSQAAFEARNPYSMIKLDISKSPGPVSESDDRYQRAKKYFTEWQEQGILIQDPVPAIYLYHIDYLLPSGKRLTRLGLVALVELSDFAEGIVKPHEETFSTVTSDRLRLTDACRAQFSQVFSLYSDKEGVIAECMAQAQRNGPPLCSVADGDGAVHTLWPLTDKDTQAEVQRLFLDKALYIADGHHRYSTALRFQEVMRERNGGLAKGSPYRYVMMYLCAMEDPGLSVLPTHRLLYLPGDVLPAGDKGLNSILAKLAPGFFLEEMRGGSREILIAEVLARMDEHAGRQPVFGLYHPGEDRCFLLELKEGAMDEFTRIDRPQVLRELDVVVLSDLAIGSFLGLTRHRCEEENLVHYYSDPDDALDVAVKESLGNGAQAPLLFLMNNTRVDQVKKVADAKLIMPHKSTYFYPKILTGLLINKLFVPGDGK
jgi:uncharacterized protein (DUF1015 family)